MALPYMPLYVADYLGDTMHLTLEQHGAYLKLLMCLWRSGGELPNDRVKIARMLGVTPARWDKIGADVMAFFEANSAYFWSTKLNEVMEKAEAFLAQKSVAGKAGAEARALKLLEQAGRPVQQPESKPESKPESEPESDLFGESLPKPSAVSVSEAAAAIWTDAPLICRKRSSLSQVRKALEAARSRRKNLAVICQAVAAYYDDPEKSKDGWKFARGVHRVVQDDFWESWAQAESVHHVDERRARPVSVQREMMKGWRDAGRSYWHESFGPRPDQPGCMIAGEIMAEFGYTPVRRAEG